MTALFPQCLPCHGWISDTFLAMATNVRADCWLDSNMHQSIVAIYFNSSLSAFFEGIKSANPFQLRREGDFCRVWSGISHHNRKCIFYARTNNISLSESDKSNIPHNTLNIGKLAEFEHALPPSYLASCESGDLASKTKIFSIRHCMLAHLNGVRRMPVDSIAIIFSPKLPGKQPSVLLTFQRNRATCGIPPGCIICGVIQRYCSTRRSAFGCA